jgi:hypothetical protein
MGERSSMPPPEQSMTSTPRSFSSFDKATLCAGEGGRGDQFPALPIEHLGVIGRLRLLALPRPGEAGLAAGVADLDGGNRALGLDKVGDALQAGDELIVP